MLIARRIAALLAIWIAFECTISLFATCQPIDQRTGANHNHKEQCTAFSGPVISISRFVVREAGHFLKEYEKELIAGFTIVLAFSTIALWLATYGLQRTTRDLAEGAERQTRAAQTAADAAMLSARAAIALESPLIRAAPNNLSHGASFSDGVRTESCAVHYLTFSNLGETRAFPVSIRYGWTIGTKLPIEPIYSVSNAFPLDSVFDANTSDIRPFAFTGFDMPLKDGEWQLICEGKLPLWLYCSLSYEDFMGTRHDQGFCWQWRNVGGGMGWRKDSTHGYNNKTTREQS
jgi:hypothetical protein